MAAQSARGAAQLGACVSALLLLLHVCSSAKVCIIGAGVGGSSLAYFINRSAPQKHDIAVFEKSDRPGGRARLAEIDGEEFEAGASIVHEKNLHLVEFAKILGLETSHPSDLDLGIWDGSKFLFQEAREDSLPWPMASIRNTLMMLTRYGILNLFRMNSFVKSMLAKWMRLYSNTLPSFSTPQDMLNSVDLFSLTKTTLSDALNQWGVTGILVDELVTAVIRIQYGQSADITALPGAVGLCGTGGQLWQVKGGNWKIPEGILKLSGANLYLNTTVLEIQKPEGGSPYLLLSDDGSEHSCDVVAIAAPLSENGVKLPVTKGIVLRAYHHTHVTFVKGLLNESYFGVETEAALPGLIATVESPSIPFSSISKQRSNSSSHTNVYKIFSRQYFSEELMAAMFKSYSHVKRIDWAAYPSYQPPEEFTPFILDDEGLFYINTFEDAASAMETAAVAAKNVAQLILEPFGEKTSVPRENIAEL